jgi:hypothetical protein
MKFGVPLSREEDSERKGSPFGGEFEFALYHDIIKLVFDVNADG